MAIGWGSLTTAAIGVVLSAWFRDKLGLAMSIALSGASLGGIALLPAMTWAAVHFGFVISAAATAGAMLLIVAPCVVAWTGPPASASHAGAALERTAAWTRRRALRDRGFWTIAGAFALALLAQAGFLIHQLALLAPAMGRERGALVVAATAIAAMVGRLGLGFAIDRLPPRRVAAISVMSQAVALSVLAATERPSWMTAASILFGLSVGNVITLPSLIIRREFELASFGLLTGLSLAVSQVTFAFGPAAVGLIHDTLGSYRPALLFCVAAHIAAAVIVSLGRAPEIEGAGSN